MFIPENGCRVFVGGLHERAITADICDRFEKFGEIADVWIAKKPGGYAYITYFDPRDADDSLILDGCRILGRVITVEMARNGVNVTNKRHLSFKCHYCHQNGHIEKYCFKKRDDEFQLNRSNKRRKLGVVDFHDDISYKKNHDTRPINYNEWNHKSNKNDNKIPNIHSASIISPATSTTITTTQDNEEMFFPHRRSKATTSITGRKNNSEEGVGGKSTSDSRSGSSADDGESYNGSRSISSNRRSTNNKNSPDHEIETSPVNNNSGKRKYFDSADRFVRRPRKPDDDDDDASVIST